MYLVLYVKCRIFSPILTLFVYSLQIYMKVPISNSTEILSVGPALIHVHRCTDGRTDGHYVGNRHLSRLN